MKYFAILTSALFVLIFNNNLISQKLNELEQFRNMNMRSIGPAVTSGRVTAIDVVATNQQIIYTGTASGGIWKSENGGTTWTPIFDEQPVCGIGALKIDPSNPDIIWAGTGEGNPRNSQTSGNGIYRSGDAGKSWIHMGLTETKTIHRICVNPKNSNELYAGAHGSAWGPGKERGVFKTTDGGSTWQKILFVNDTTGCADLVMDPVNPNKLFAAMYQYHRKPWFFNSGGKGSGLYMTIDAGKTWKQMTSKDGLPEGNIGRIGLAIAPGNPKIVYALIEAEKTGLYKSTDGGFKWNLVTTDHVDDRPFYYHEIYVDPKNENHLIYLHSTVSESIDGGLTWKTLLPYYGVHPDHHAFWWSSENSSYMIEGNDGGLNISRDGGKNWQFAANLPLAQFYHINYDMETPYNVYGGMQDNGSWRGPAYVWNQSGIRDADWQELYFGDGFDVVPNPENSNFVYAMSQGGNLTEIDIKTGQERFIMPVHPENVKLRFNWNAGIAQDPFNNNGIYYGSQFVHYSANNGADWRIISPDLTSNDTTKQKASTSGGLTIDATAAENYCTILCITPSVLDKNMIWVGTDDGRIQLTLDGGLTWNNVAKNIPGMPANGWIAQIVTSEHSRDEAFVVVNNYRLNDWKPYLFYTKNAGKSWTGLVDEKKVTGHCLSIAQDHKEPKLLFLGTEHGLYVSFDSGTTWNQWKHDYPSVATQDLKIHPRENDLIIGTFGRAAYILDDITPLRLYASQKDKFEKQKLIALPSPDAIDANTKRPAGQRFPADATFEGENKAAAAALKYFYRFEENKPNEEKEKSKQDKPKNNQSAVSVEGDQPNDHSVTKDTKVSIHILNMKGDTIRTIRHEPDTGYNCVYWGFDTFGEYWPGHGEKKPGDIKPGGGIEVAPGTYKVVYVLNELKDSTVINIKYDPRLVFDEQIYNTRKSLYDRSFANIRRATAAFDNIREMKKNIEMVKSTLAYTPEKEKKTLIELSDSLIRELNKLEELYMFPRDTKGIRDDSDKLQTYLWLSVSYLESGRMSPEQNCINAIQNAEKKTNEVVGKINLFIEKRWTQWQNSVNSTQRTLFKEIQKTE